MKLPIHTALVAVLLTVAGCTSDSDYDGCHGTGCLVDNPDRLDRSIDSKPQFRSSNDDVDDRPQFDREGNPNFDTQGNYQGCHGIGCEVDTPDDDDSE